MFKPIGNSKRAYDHGYRDGLSGGCKDNIYSYVSLKANGISLGAWYDSGYEHGKQDKRKNKK